MLDIIIGHLPNLLGAEIGIRPFGEIERFVRLFREYYARYSGSSFRIVIHQILYRGIVRYKVVRYLEYLKLHGRADVLRIQTDVNFRDCGLQVRDVVGFEGNQAVCTLAGKDYSVLDVRFANSDRLERLLNIVQPDALNTVVGCMVEIRLGNSIPIATDESLGE